MTMEVELTVVRAGAPPVEVQVRAGAAATIGALADRLPGHDGGGRDIVAPVPVDPAGPSALHRDTAMGDAAFAHGAVVTVTPESGVAPAPVSPRGSRDVPRSPRTVVAVLSGPGTGARLELQSGHHELIVDGTGLRPAAGAPADLVIEPSAVDAVFRVGATVVRVEAPGSSPRPTGAPRPRPGPDGRVAIAPPPRTVTPCPDTVVEVPAPPRRPERRRVGVAAVVAPVVLGAVLFAITRSVVMLAFVALAPLVALGSMLEDVVRIRREHRRALHAHDGERARADAELEVGRAYEVDAWRAASPDAVTLIGELLTAGPRVWSRRATDDDHLVLRVGLGDRPSRVVLRTVGSHEGWSGPVVPGGAASNAIQPLVPITVDLRTDGVLGIVGPERAASVRWMLVQAAALHAPRGLAIAVIGSPDSLPPGIPRWPHVDRLGGGSAVALDAGAASDLAARLTTLVRDRGASGPGAGHAPVLLVVATPDLVDRAALHEVLTTGPGVGVVTIWSTPGTRALPVECTTTVEVRTDGGRVTTGATSTRVDVVDLLAVMPGEVASRAIAPLRDAAVHDDRHGVPTTVGWTTAFGVDPSIADGGDGDDPLVGIREALGRGTRSPGSLVVPIGVGARGIVRVDLRHDGPHALIAGTTGSGKSELLRTLVVGLAFHHPPERCSFLLVDYKGGATFRDCVGLPHVVGVCTDLDPSLAERVLVSLGAELRHRERLLADAGAADLATMERDRPDLAPPALVIVVDELAALVREVPSFVDGLVDIAQRGRSLGLHLVLATQRPSGVVTDHIRTNTNLRIALRMGTRAESEDVIDATDAARIERDRPGRALLRVGPSELVEFQAATLNVAGGTTSAPGAVTVRSVDDRIGPPGAAGGGEATRALVTGIVEEHRTRNAPPLRRPWLEPLPSLIPVATLPAPTGTDVTIGWCDEPNRQRRIPFGFDLAGDGLLITGPPGSGRTAALRMLAVAAVATADRVGVSSDPPVTLVVVDPAGDLADLVGHRACAMVVGDERARLARLVDWLGRVIAARTRGDALGSVDDPALALAPGGRVLLLVDNYDLVADGLERARRPEWIEALHQVFSRGAAVGVLACVTSARTPRPPNALVAAFPRVLALGAPDLLDATAGLPRSDGRPGCGVDHRGLLVQLALAPAASVSTGWPRGSVAAFAELPDRVRPVGGDARAFAVAEPGNEPVGVPSEGRDLLVVGPPGSGRSCALVRIAQIEAAVPGTEVVLIAGRDPEVASRVIAALDGPGPRDEPGGRDRPGSGPGHRVVIIDDLDDVGPEVEAALERVLASGAERSVRVVAAVDNRVALRAFTGPIARLRRARRGLLLHPEPEDGEILGVTLSPYPEEVYPPGRGYLVRGREVRLVQVVTEDPMHP